MARRGENIYKRKDGRWEGRYKNGFKPAALLQKKQIANENRMHCKCSFGKVVQM